MLAEVGYIQMEELITNQEVRLTAKSTVNPRIEDFDSWMREMDSSDPPFIEEVDGEHPSLDSS